MVAWLLLGLSVVLIAVCGVFVAGEFALLTTNPAAAERAAQAGDRKARGVLAALRNLSIELSGVQVAITLTNLAIGFLAESALAGLLHAPLRSIGVQGQAVAPVAVGLALAVSTLMTMLFGEMVPKNLAIAMPFALARVVQAPVRAFTRLLRVPIRALNAMANAVLAIVGLHARDELPSARSPEELVSLVRHSAREGVLGHGTARLVVRSLTLGERRARDVLTPRPRMVTITSQTLVADMLDVVRTTGHARLPVTGSGGLDDIVGVVELHRAITVPAAARRRTRVADVMGPAVEVPETLAVDVVLQRLEQRGARMAIVVDEYGGTAGLVTGEDVLEELVGELDDEHDTPAPAVRRVPGGFEVSGLLRPDEVTAATGRPLPSSGVYETIGGLVMSELGRVPHEGDRIVVDGTEVAVLRMVDRRVDTVLVSPLADGAPA